MGDSRNIQKENPGCSNVSQLEMHLNEKLKMETSIMDMPTEVLEIIFKDLFENTSSVEDIINLCKTCKRWKNIVEAMFKDKGIYFLSFYLVLIQSFYYFIRNIN